MKEGIFMTVICIFLLFNAIYVNINPSAVNTMVIGAFTGLIATVLTVGVISGITVLGSGLNAESIKIMFGVASLINVLFSITIAGFPVGIGLANNVLQIFVNQDFMNLGMGISTGLSIIALISGITTIVD